MARRAPATSSSTPTTTACSSAMRQGDYKYVYAEQRSRARCGVWAEPFTKLRLQKIFNLFQDPFERADITSNTFWDWQLNHIGSVYGAMDDVIKFVATFKEFRRVRSRRASSPRRSWKRPSTNQGKQSEGRGARREHRQDSRRRQSVDRTAAAAAGHQVSGAASVRPADRRFHRQPASRFRSVRRACLQ